MKKIDDQIAETKKYRMLCDTAQNEVNILKKTIEKMAGDKRAMEQELQLKREYTRKLEYKLVS